MADPQIEKELEKLKSDIASLRSDLGELTHTMRDVGSRRAGEARDRVADDLRNTREQLRRRLDTARTRGQETYHDLEERVGEHPLGSLAAAAGVGFILGKLLRAGDKH